MDFQSTGNQEDGETFSETDSTMNEDGVSGYAASIMERQPFRGYDLSAVLAGGDRQAVFKSHDSILDRPVAVKVMRPWNEREGIVEDFFSLAGSIARLKCPGVARGLDAGRGDGDFFLVYEFVPGESLEHKLTRRQSGKLTDKEALKLVVEIVGVLQNLFDRGNPHGNLKPSNIVIADGGIPRLTDIGFAWNLAWPTDDEAFLANPDYLPPERIAGELNVDIRGDLYSLGCIWFRALYGRPVFIGETPEETIRMHMEEKAPLLCSLDPKISEETSQLICWLLEKERDDRPRTPRAFLKKLAGHPLVVVDDAVVDGDEDEDDADVDVDVDANINTGDVESGKEEIERGEELSGDGVNVDAGVLNITDGAEPEEDAASEILSDVDREVADTGETEAERITAVDTSVTEPDVADETREQSREMT